MSKNIFHTDGDFSLKKSFSKFTKNYAIVIGIFLLGVIFSFSSKYFLKMENMTNILLQSSTIGIVSIGQAFVITAGDF